MTNSSAPQKRPVGRPKSTDPSKKSPTTAFSIPLNIMGEILFDMEKHGQTNKSAKMVEIIQYWLDNCPDRVVNKIERKKGGDGSAKRAFGSRYGQ